MSKQNNWWQLEAFSLKKPLLIKRLKTIKNIRDFFDNQDFLEVETPAVQVCPGMEVHTKFFEIILESQLGEPKKRYLHTSPEFAMKKLLVAGLDKIYQIAKVFRNAEVSDHHHPEFSMLEWYRTGCDYTVLMDDCESLIKKCASINEDGLLRFKDKTCDPNKNWERASVASLFDKYAGINFDEIIGDGLNPDPLIISEKARNIGIYVPEDYSFEDVFFKIFMEKVEPNLGIGVPTIVYDYPLCMAALSRKKKQDSRLAERFELYICGLEVANAFSELTDAKEQRARFYRDMEQKKMLYGNFCYPDEDFLNALEQGMPESAGIALGVDRLVMLVCGADNIENILWAPISL